MRSRTHTLAALIVATTFVLTACGKKTNDETAALPPPEPAAAGESVAVRSAATEIGEILVGRDGLTLYGFTNDIDGTSTCTGTCAEAWPPVLVSADWTVGPGLDSGVFSTVVRPDGGEQLVAGRWPLYYYSGDAAPGDVNGQGSGEVWYTVGTDAVLIQEPAPAGESAAGAASATTTVRLAGSPLGEILVDGEGNTLYGFTKDADGTPTCTDNCAATWPALLVEGDATLGDGLDASVFTLVDGVQGGLQVKAGEWPLYRFSGDAAPGDVNGQGSGGVWFVVAADGTLVKDEGAADPAPPEDDDGY